MYNLFQQTDDPSIICALPDGAKLPSFLRGEGWAFGGKVREIRSEQLEFDKASIDDVVRSQGFYIYTRL